jgi:hypothetical protein
LVKRFNGHDITLNTHEPAQDVEKGKPQTSQVSKMAKRATAKAMS